MPIISTLVPIQYENESKEKDEERGEDKEESWRSLAQYESE